MGAALTRAVGRTADSSSSMASSPSRTSSRRRGPESSLRPPLRCAKCLAAASWSRQIHLCSRCQFPYCSDCMGVAPAEMRREVEATGSGSSVGVGDASAGRGHIPRPQTLERGHAVVGARASSSTASPASSPTRSRGYVYLCPSCRSFLLRLPDTLLRYIELFLTHRSQDRLLRVCTRFAGVVWLPYEYVESLEHAFQWREPFDILHTSPRSVVLRCTVRATGAVCAVKLTPKSRLLSRRLWQRLQDLLDIRAAGSRYCHSCDLDSLHDDTALQADDRGSPTPVTTRSDAAYREATDSPTMPQSFVTVHSMFHTRDLIGCSMTFCDPARFVPLFDCLQWTGEGDVPPTAQCSGDAMEREDATEGSSGADFAIWTEQRCIAVLRVLLEAVSWLHDTLGAVHRHLSLESIVVDVGALIASTNMREKTQQRRAARSAVILLGFSSARFTQPPASALAVPSPPSSPAHGASAADETTFSRTVRTPAATDAMNGSQSPLHGSIASGAEEPIVLTPSSPTRLPLQPASPTTPSSAPLSPSSPVSRSPAMSAATVTGAQRLPEPSAAGGSKQFVRPPRLPLLKGSEVMQRSAGLYCRGARERELLVAHGSHAMGFVQAAEYTRRFVTLPAGDATLYSSSSRIPVHNDHHRVARQAVSEVTEEAQTLREGDSSREQLHGVRGLETVVAASATLPSDDTDDEAEPPLLVGTPCAALGFAAPELLPALAAKSLVPSTGVTASDMQAWDAYALGGVWYHLLSAVVRQDKLRRRHRSSSSSLQPGPSDAAGSRRHWQRTAAETQASSYSSEMLIGMPPLASLDEVREVVSAGAWELLLRLMHIDPNKRWMCAQALQFIDSL